MISIIIPVYNVETYLEECVNSILIQDFSDWEILLIDDGSTDKSASIADSLAESDSRIFCYHFENGGLSVARNRGLDIAKGDLVMFIDSDDMLYPGALGNLSECLKKENVDLVEGMVIRGKNYKIFEPTSYKSKFLSSEEAVANVLYQKFMLPSACGKLFKKSLFDDLRFTPGIFYEDLDLFYFIFQRCNIIAYISTPVYFYRDTSGSIINSWNPRRLDVLKVTEKIEHHISNEKPLLLPAARDRRLSANFNMFALCSFNDDKLNADGCWRLIKQYRMASLFNPKVRFKNKAGIIISFFGKRFFNLVARFVYK